MKKERSALSTAGTGIFTIVGIVYILPILIVLMNSFKKKVYINKQPFQLPDEKTMAGLENYMTAIDKYNLLSAVGWIWNDFLLPYLVLDLNKYKTISIAIQYMKGSYGRVDMGAVMAALILAVIPVIIFYLSCQKHIIKGVAAGAVKG